jgi:hypothetical protein
MSFRFHPGVWFAALFGIVLVLLGGCATQPQIKVLTRAAFTLDAVQKRTEIATKIAEEIKLTLPPIRADGYQWEIFAHDSRYLRQTSEITPPEGRERISSVTFLALNPTARTTLIRFLLVPVGNAKESQPVDSHDVAVKIELR